MVEQTTSKAILQWLLRKDSAAQCFIQDVHKAAIITSCQDNSFWYLGTVPFRTVRCIGIVIGVKVYERRSLYFVDDGTATIQCIFSHPAIKPRSAVGQSKQACELIPPPTQPLCEVGATVRIIGRVESWRDTRQINLDDLVPCWAGEEIKHWVETANLHKTYYCKPFTIPPKAPPTPGRPSTFLTKESATAGKIRSPPSKSISGGITGSPEDLLRLRHPTRLRSKELTKNALKIYLKNYMDVVSYNSFCSYRESFPLSRMSQIKGFKLSYLRQVPELYNLGKRIAKSESTAAKHTICLTVKKLFISAIRELIKDGTVILHDENGPVWETLDHRISIWPASQSIGSRTGKSSIMKNLTNLSKCTEEVAELSDSSPKEESYIPIIPEMLCPFIVNVLKGLTKSQQTRSGGQKETARNLGFSVREIRHHLNQDMRWEHIGDYMIIDTLYLLERTSVVQSIGNERWSLV